MTERPSDIYIIAREELGVIVDYRSKLFTSYQIAQCYADVVYGEGNWIVLKYSRPVPYRGQK